ncbi:hypothetical protein PRUPE_3G261100 [Prunus persica]|uniref:Uncharacterized protein n=1 Tax=Prunus persica TaxID=3760 RepID=A0A251Q5L8_PRUPE|nr:hypothetical protein PRUPE_3G261100 [Prunus persica]
MFINLVSLGMNHQINIPVGNPLRSEASTSRERSTRELHEHIFSFIAMLAGLLQLKQGVFDTDYLTLVSLVVALIIFCGSLIGSTYIRQAHPNSDLAKLMDKISLPFGALALVFELVILCTGFRVSLPLHLDRLVCELCS